MELEAGEVYRDRLKDEYVIICAINDYISVMCFHINKDWDKDSIKKVDYDYDNLLHKIKTAYFGRVNKLSYNKLAKLMLLKG